MSFQSLFTKVFNGTLHEGREVPMLRDVTNKYPFFSLAHYFLLKNTSQDERAYQRIAAKTAMHFNNPFLLHEHLQDLPVAEEMEEKAGSIQTAEQHSSIQQIDEPMVTETPVESSDNGFDLPSNNAPVSRPEPFLRASAGELPETEENTTASDILKTTREAEVPVIKMDRPAVDHIPSLAAASPEQAAEKEAPLFQPLFTSDYFASQGIKLSEETQPKDRMGKQLKSFTEWLKTMKKVHDNKLPGSDAPVDLAVQTLAEKSNKEEEVLTEAMAEVFLQQGKTNKAKEIYEKLSLLNPAKIAYFAAKIEQIK